jgi:hypothetical protein
VHNDRPHGKAASGPQINNRAGSGHNKESATEDPVITLTKKPGKEDAVAGFYIGLQLKHEQTKGFRAQKKAPRCGAFFGK